VTVAVQPIRFFQTCTHVVGNRLLGPDERTVQADEHRANTLTLGHRACRGCGEALGARYVLDAATRATGGKVVAVNAITPEPEES
jgi:pyruvate ferredoxin oxidoreductase beta subunit